MAENLVIYSGLGELGKVKKTLVAREAKRLGYRSTSDFVWDALRTVAKNRFKEDLEKVLTREAKNRGPMQRIKGAK